MKTTSKTTKQQTYRQGDVLLVRVDSIPKEDANRAKSGNPILAYGEVTGHHHQVQSLSACLVETPEAVYLDQPEVSALLTHQEHAPITLPKGKYKIVHQREYRPAGIVRVAD